MNRLIAVGLAALLVGCGETPTQPPAEFDVDVQFAVAGADVWQNAWDHDDCHPGTWGPFCHAYKGKVRQVATPSGNMHYVYRQDGWYTAVYPGYSVQVESSYEEKFHLRRGDPQVHSWARTGEETIHRLDGTTVLCSWVERYHYANLHVTQDIHDYTCTVS